MRRLAIIICVALPVFVAMSSCSTEGGDDYSPCVVDGDCGGGGLFCVNGVCQKPAGCATDAECPTGLRCCGGSCDAVECCDDAGCGQTEMCKAGACWGTQCMINGEQKGCYNGCHAGSQTCQQGYWTTCDAPEYMASEICEDGIDNNCNGEIDEGCLCPEGLTKDCMTELCGAGVRTCVGGVWGECVALSDCCTPGESEEEPCGSCGTRSRACAETFSWEQWTECTGEGMCPAGEVETQPCGTACGEQTRTCDAACLWGDWTPCGQGGVCLPGEKEEMECGNCGLQEKFCGDDCYWAPWGDCVEGAGCSAGETQTKECGNCGTATKSCTMDCQWGDWGSCQGEGVCAPGEKQSESCDFCGVKERTCSPGCAWGNYGSCQAGGECTPGQSQEQACGPSSSQGNCKQGEQQRSCNASCMWNNWGSCLGAVYPENEICGDNIDQNCNGMGDDGDPDEYENNDSCDTCYMLYGTGPDGEDPETTVYPTFDSAKGGSDPADYFCFKGADDINWGLPEHVIIELTNQPVGIDGDVILYKGYSACSSGTATSANIVVGGGDEKIDWQENFNSPDDDTYYIKVENWSNKGNCDWPYTLFIKGLK